MPPTGPRAPHEAEGRAPAAWAPVLDGTDRERALAAVAELAADVAELPLEGTSLAGGSVGRALLHAHLASDDPAQRTAAIAGLRHATTSLGTPGGPSSLHVGAAGIGWALAHLGGDLLDDRDRCTSLDRALLRLLDRQPWPGRFDLVTGLVGLGVYALERLDVPEGRALLERVVQRLDETAVREGDDVTWWTPPAWMSEEVRRRSPSGHVDLGVAHGVPGPIALLGAACAADVASETARTLLEGAVGWLTRDAVRDHTIGYWSSEPPDGAEARTAWCYGAPGVAAALLIAARGADQPAWEHAAIGLARRAAARPLDDTGVVDAGVCHGATGVGLTFARLAQATGDAVLQDAARWWFAHALTLRAPGAGIAGFRFEDAAGAPAPGLLDGATGVALALHAAATDHAPTWDRTLLLSAASVSATAPTSTGPARRGGLV